jgi:hypothetical protein
MRYLPIVLGMVLIVGLTIPQIKMTDRLSGTNVTTAQRAELLNLVPKDFGDWHGEDKAVDPDIQKTAGAVGAVSRAYRNSRTGERVDLWLIVGHSRDVSFHTPDVCYPGSGFEARGKENSLYPFVMAGMPETPMWTNTFLKEDVTGRQMIRVFWTWYNPESKENENKIVWEAPNNARWHFGNSRALYKMYFTSEMRDPMETAEQSACLRFAKEFLPEVDKALAQVCDKLEPNGTKVGETNATGELTAATSADGTDATKKEPAADDKSAAPATDGAAAGSPTGGENKSTVTIDTTNSGATPTTEAPKADK